MIANPIVHIVDDDEAVRRSLAFMLGSAGLAVRVYDSATAFLDGIDTLQTGCLITDVRMPEMSGIELLQRIRERLPSLPAIVITGHGDVPLAVEAMKAGAIDFIEKPFDEEAILNAVKAALEQTGDEVDGDLAAVNARLASLSERERQVLEGLVAGHPNKAIANGLGISPRTVEVYRANLMTKMEANSLSELIRMAILAHVPGSHRAR
ncbi:two-component system response regulator [Methyloceanibacter superfactus]|uniref:Two-component system response regulator n=1 Tax=Methyloceanibacter superfactus TaxID=1774969 RepID=A0A1E3VVP3_9HYPH|nr:response regulator FixJ [Methyloceanibacter superfactus]ODR97630.1 two-component system response regulator [Methyloceanibacter superfactus]